MCCMVCSDWEKGKLTSKEALRNLGELINTDGDLGNEHYWRAIDKVMESEVPFKESDEDLGRAYSEEMREE